MSGNDSKIKEAKSCIAKAEEHLKTSIIKMKFKPDYDMAAIEYERAAICYKNANDLKNARDCYLNASKNHNLNRNFFHEAKAKENAASICKDLKENLIAAKYIQEACESYVLSGSMDTASLTIDKCAKWFEYSDPETAITMYEKGLALVQQTDRSKMAAEFMNRLAHLYIRSEKYDKAIKIVNSEIDKYLETKDFLKVGQLSLSLTLLGLAKEDTVETSKLLNRCFQAEGFELSQEAALCGSILKAYEDGDDDLFQKLLQNGLIRSMDNEYLRLVKKIKVPDANGVESSGITFENEEDLK
ncbi:Gamma-soluble NSF attachment protein [Strongyloides ratti]|uniref:Gamma-soluble NSF attachment protein n=1 Tax=Strongyloides ratti TaxID=34506 RepID=A0A090L4N3_STRRB|nr:Gamma-soluble NSF attachment protein [Strongyloides ratti]CEF62464.1 Gamma-soluble NSF attachment protein [Strongyloides ratti]